MPLVLHGHTHAADGVARLGAVQVVNPGSLRYGAGRFALVRMERGRRGGRWRVGAVQLVQLGEEGGDDGDGDGGGIVLGGHRGVGTSWSLAVSAVGALLLLLVAWLRRGGEQHGEGKCGDPSE